MYVSAEAIAFFVFLAILVAVFAWAVGHDQGAEWEERAARRRGNKRVRVRHLDPIVERVEKLENAAAPTTTKENN